MLSVYFPTQKRSKMRVTMSSRAVRPVSSPSASRAPSASVSTTSGVSGGERLVRRTDRVQGAVDGLGLPCVGEQRAARGNAGRKAVSDRVDQRIQPAGHYGIKGDQMLRHRARRPAVSKRRSLRRGFDRPC